MTRRRTRSRSNPRAGQALLLLALALIVAALAAWWQQQPPRPPAATGPAPATIRIATWNLRQFSDRQNIDLRTISNIITRSQFDLLAIQEVKKEGEEVDRLLNVLGPPWRTTSLSPMTGNHERFVYLYRGDHLQEISTPTPLDGNGADFFDRTPYRARFRAGNFDFTLITVHFSYTDTARRRGEAMAMARMSKEIAARESEKDVIVLGDLNEQGAGNLGYFERWDWQSVIRQPTALGSKDIFDHIVLNRRHTREWTGEAGVVRFDEMYFNNNDKQARGSVSDHRPAYADFSTALPDDD